VNEDPAIGLIEQLRLENEKLKAALSNGGNTPSATLPDGRIASLKAKIEELTSELQDKETEIERQKEIIASSEVQMQDQAVQTDFYDRPGRHTMESKLLVPLVSRPALILLSPSSILSEKNIYVIDSLSSIIGRSPQCSISLTDGTTILDVQCSINWSDNRLFLFPRADADIYVNAHRLQSGPGEAKELFNGDRLGLGVEGEYFFLIVIPTGQLDVIDRINGEMLRCSYWQARAEFFEMRYRWSRDDCYRRIMQERQHTTALLAEMTEQCKRIFRDARNTGKP